MYCAIIIGNNCTHSGNFSCCTYMVNNEYDKFRSFSPSLYDFILASNLHIFAWKSRQNFSFSLQWPGGSTQRLGLLSIGFAKSQPEHRKAHLVKTQRRTAKMSEVWKPRGIALGKRYFWKIILLPFQLDIRQTIFFITISTG